MNPKVMCLIVLSCMDLSEEGKKDLEKMIAALKKTKSWSIERITLMEDRRSAV